MSVSDLLVLDIEPERDSKHGNAGDLIAALANIGVFGPSIRIRIGPRIPLDYVHRVIIAPR